MRTVMISAAFLLVVFSLTFFSCSKKEGEKGEIEQMTDDAAEVIVDRIRTPMNQAREVKDLEMERARAIDKTLKDD